MNDIKRTRLGELVHELGEGEMPERYEEALGLTEGAPELIMRRADL